MAMGYMNGPINKIYEVIGNTLIKPSKISWNGGRLIGEEQRCTRSYCFKGSHEAKWTANMTIMVFKLLTSSKSVTYTRKMRR